RRKRLISVCDHPATLSVAARIVRLLNCAIATALLYRSIRIDRGEHLTSLVDYRRPNKLRPYRFLTPIFGGATELRIVINPETVHFGRPNGGRLATLAA